MEQRRANRYRLQLPLEILQLGDEIVHLTEKTRDISSSGICFVSPTDVAIGGRIEYVITLSGRTPPVRLRCLGTVVRSDQPRMADSAGFEVGATLDRYRFLREEEAEVLGATA